MSSPEKIETPETPPDAGTDTVTIPRDLYEELVDGVEELRERVEELEEEVEGVRTQTAEDRARIRQRVSKLEEEGSEYEPTTKKDKIRRAVVENFSSWSIDTMKGSALVTQVKSRSDNRNGDPAKGREGKSVHQHVFEFLEEEVQHREVVEVLEELGESEYYEFVEDGRKLLLKSG